MSTELKPLDEGQRALTIVYNEYEGRDELIGYLNEVFGNGQLIYHRGSVPDADGLIELLKQEKDTGRVSIRSGEKLVFGWFLELKDLTDKWCDSYIERVLEMRYKLDAINPADHHHVICLRYEIGTFPEEAMSREKAKILLRLANRVKESNSEGKIISQNIYILRKTRLEEYGPQEKCMARLMYLLSRRGKTEVVDFSVERSCCVYMIKGADYYEEQRTSCQKEIEDIHGWLEQRIDPELERLIERAAGIIEAKLTEVHEFEKAFNRKISAFPVSKSYYKGSFFKGFESEIDSSSPKIKKYKKRYVSEKMGETVSVMGKELREAAKIVDNDYHYPDLLLLNNYLEADENEAENEKPEDRLYKTIYERLRLSSRHMDMELSFYEEKLIFKIYKQFREMLVAELSKTEKKKEQAEIRLIMKTHELSEAGEYTSLRDCLDRIVDKVEPGFIHGREPLGSSRTILVCGNVVLNWELKNFDVTDASIVYSCNAISPYEIAVISSFLMVDMDSDSSYYVNESDDDTDEMAVIVEERLMDIIY